MGVIDQNMDFYIWLKIGVLPFPFHTTYDTYTKKNITCNLLCKYTTWNESQERIHITKIITRILRDILITKIITRIIRDILVTKIITKIIRDILVTKIITIIIRDILITKIIKRIIRDIHITKIITRIIRDIHIFENNYGNYSLRK